MENAQVVDLKASAVDFGLDPTWVADIIAKYGPEVLALVVECLRQGLSVTFVTELITKFGPIIMELLVNLMNKKKMGVAVHAGNPFLVVLVETYLPMLLKQVMPSISAASVAAIVQAIVSLL